MKGKLEKDLDETLEIHTENLRSQKGTPEIISPYCSEVRRFFFWRAERGYQPNGYQPVNSLDIKAYLNDHKWFNSQIARNHTLAALLSFFSLGYRTGGHNTNPTGQFPIPRMHKNPTNGWMGSNSSN
jgi:site-specific recombinase XerD